MTTTQAPASRWASPPPSWDAAGLLDLRDDVTQPLPADLGTPVPLLDPERDGWRLTAYVHRRRDPQGITRGAESYLAITSPDGATAVLAVYRPSGDFAPKALAEAVPGLKPLIRPVSSPKQRPEPQHAAAAWGHVPAVHAVLTDPGEWLPLAAAHPHAALPEGLQTVLTAAPLPEEAILTWASHSKSVAEATPWWAELGPCRVREASVWAQHGFTADEAAAWLQVLRETSHGTAAKGAYDWVKRGFTPGEAEPWWAHRFYVRTPDNARRAADAGWTAEDCAQLAERVKAELGDDAVRHSFGKEVERWPQVLIRHWPKAVRDPERAFLYWRAGIPPDEATGLDRGSAPPGEHQLATLAALNPAPRLVPGR